MRTWPSNIEFSLDTPRDRESYSIQDIANSLSKICRYTGHINTFYSVAQHCIIFSHMVPFEWAKHAFLHDANEFVLNDLSSMFKNHPMFAEYNRFKKVIELEIYQAFSLQSIIPPWEKYHEKLTQMEKDSFRRNIGGLVAQEHDIAKVAFMSRFAELFNG